MPNYLGRLVHWIANSPAGRKWACSSSFDIHGGFYLGIRLILLIRALPGMETLNSTKPNPDSKVACETCTKTNMVMVFREITTKANEDYEKIVRDTCRSIGFVFDDVGLDADQCQGMDHIVYFGRFRLI